MKKVILTAMGFCLLSGAVAHAQTQIRCEDKNGVLELLLTQISGPNYQYQLAVKKSIKPSTSGMAIERAFTTGTSFIGDGLTLSISKFPKQDLFPNRWAQYWAIVDVPGLENLDVACANFNQ